MKIAIKELEGRDHYVVPMVMITVGVHAGSNGPVFYPANELQNSVPFWNGKPIVVYHPSQYGHTFAGDPEVFTRQRIGTIFNTRFDGHRLLADAWIDVGRVGIVDPRVERAIRTKSIMEVSTGLTFEMGVDPGVHNGREYHTEASRVAPDHLAVLPDLRGACSVADGAGLCRNDDAPAQSRSGPAVASVGGYAGWDACNVGSPDVAACSDEAPLVMPSMWE